MICDKLPGSECNDKKDTGNEKAILLKRLLSIVVMESADIEDGYLDKLAEYSSTKKEIMGKIGNLNGDKIDTEHCNEIKGLIKEIQEINEKNAKDLVNLREKIKDELSALHTSKKTHNAYFSNAIADQLEEA